MEFGTEQTLSLIKQALSQNTTDAYDMLYHIVCKDASLLINKYCAGLQPADKEDILHDVVWRVLQDLVRFYEASSQNTEQQRNAYLKKLTYNVCIDFYRKAKNTALFEITDISEITDTTLGDGFVKRIEDKELFLWALKKTFEINTSPDKLLAFVFSRLLWPNKKKNGDPKAIVEQFEGVPIQTVYEHMVADLTDVLGDTIPREVLMPLREKVFEERVGRTFHMTAHQIADSSNWIVKKVKEHNKNEC